MVYTHTKLLRFYFYFLFMYMCTYVSGGPQKPQEGTGPLELGLYVVMEIELWSSRKPSSGVISEPSLQASIIFNQHIRIVCVVWYFNTCV